MICDDKKFGHLWKNFMIREQNNLTLKEKLLTLYKAVLI